MENPVGDDPVTGTAIATGTPPTAKLTEKADRGCPFI
jgi:hypothetical protein